MAGEPVSDTLFYEVTVVKAGAQPLLEPAKLGTLGNFFVRNLFIRETFAQTAYTRARSRDATKYQIIVIQVYTYSYNIFLCKNQVQLTVYIKKYYI